MSANISQKKSNTHWMPRTAGIINLIASGGFFAYGLWTIIDGYKALVNDPDDPEVIGGFMILSCFITPLLSGIFALQRKHWLAAMILSVFGLPATFLSFILIVLSKEKFQGGTQTNQT